MATRISKEGPSSPLAVTVVIPSRNEGALLEGVVRKVAEALVPAVRLRILVVDDASDDNTAEILRRLAAELPLASIRNEKPEGFGGALKVGIRAVTTPWIAFTDADGQYDARDILRLLERRGPEGLILTGLRPHRADPPVRVFISVVFRMLIRSLFGLRMSDTTTSLKVGSTETLQEVAAEVKYMNGSFWSEFMVRWNARGYSFLEVPVRHYARHGSRSRVYATGAVGRLVLHQFVAALRLWRDSVQGSRGFASALPASDREAGTA